MGYGKPDLHNTSERADMLQFSQKLTSKMIEHANLELWICDKFCAIFSDHILLFLGSTAYL